MAKTKFGGINPLLDQYNKNPEWYRSGFSVFLGSGRGLIGIIYLFEQGDNAKA